MEKKVKSKKTPIIRDKEPHHFVDLHGMIQNRAYEFYLKRTQQAIPGDALSDWVQAEEDVIGSKTSPHA